jgi:NADH:ubiquinone oxidoreductase subunit 5 (subunit L)/multisubunit Na+/H+ antiporter MnhA subunit
MRILPLITVFVGAMAHFYLPSGLHGWLDADHSYQVFWLMVREVVVTTGFFGLAGVLFFAKRQTAESEGCLPEIMVVATVGVTLAYSWLRVIQIAFGDSRQFSEVARRMGEQLYLALPLLSLIAGALLAAAVKAWVRRGSASSAAN